MTSGGRYARYRAPADDGAKLVVPPWGEWPELILAASQKRAAGALAIAGQSWAEWAKASRREVLERALGYTKSFGGEFVGAIDPDTPVVVTGHQPELMHAGVWLKNFAAAEASRATGGVSLNLVIDGDRCKRTSILVPGGSPAEPRLTPVEFDDPAAAVPWEERGVVDRGLFGSFADRVLEAGRSLLNHPVVESWWPMAMERVDATGRIGLGFAQARRLAEQEWGVRNLELPQSELCQTTAFRQFVVAVLSDLPRFAAAYNASLADYRHAHGLRNAAQPAPDLAKIGPWQQAPFWLWTAKDSQRRPLFARLEPQDGGVIVVTDQRGFERRLDCRDDGAAAVAELAGWEAAGMKLRSRALTTTMFTRLAVADLFIHGIGGAKYDEVTDAIVERFFGVTAPPFAVLSGTLLLPIGVAARREYLELPGDLRHALRELRYHPERAVVASANFDGAASLSAPVRAALDAKSGWIATPKTPANAAQRHREIAAANGVLYAQVAQLEGRLNERLGHALASGRGARILAGREYAACLFSRERLQQFLLDFQSPMA